VVSDSDADTDTGTAGPFEITWTTTNPLDADATSGYALFSGDVGAGDFLYRYGVVLRRLRALGRRPRRVAARRLQRGDRQRGRALRVPRVLQLELT
jgi:hypothetical protein